MSGAMTTTVTRTEIVLVAGFFGALLGVYLATRGNLVALAPKLFSGLLVTILIAFFSALLSLATSFVIGLSKLSGSGFIRWPAIVYSELFRGTSLLVQLFWLFYVLPHFGISLEPFTVAVLGIGLNYGAYGSEIVRGAIQAVPRGQREAVVALNLSYVSALWRIILPQSLPFMIAPYGNLMIQLLKATSLVSLITIGDLTFESYQLDQFTGESLKIFSIVLMTYFALSLCVSIAFRFAERYANAAFGRRPATT
jgi:polar amino acid transport system permease protein